MQASQAHMLPPLDVGGVPKRRAASGKNGGEDGSGGKSGSWKILSLFWKSDNHWQQTHLRSDLNFDFQNDINQLLPGIILLMS